MEARVQAFTLVDGGQPAERTAQALADFVAAAEHTLESSMDLLSWRAVKDITASSSGTTVVDGVPATSKNLFYRARAQ